MTWAKEPQATALTGPHRLLRALLRTMGFNTLDEYPVGKYRLDCYVQDLHMGFECDGKRIHAGTRKQQKDHNRDEWIFENAGIPILRIQSDALQFTLWDKLTPQILEFMEEYGDDIEERREKSASIQS